MKWLARSLALALLVAMPLSAQTINEINYDDDGGDFEEFVEIYAAGGGDYSDYALVLYNGSNGTEYSRTNLGTIPGDGYLVIGASVVPNLDITLGSGTTNLIQNGAPDGLAIVRISTNQCLQFLSYEGEMTAVGGECDGVTSTEIAASDIDPSSLSGDVVLQRIPNITGPFTQTSDGTDAGVIADGTPGLPNLSGPSVYGEITLMGVNATNVAIDPCYEGTTGPFTVTVESLPANGTLRDNGAVIASAPHAVSGNLTYTPNTNYSGVDTFTWSVEDGQGLSSDPVTQELGVQSDKVVISEVMYSPGGDDRVFEFVEIYNYSNSAVTLTRLDSRPENPVDTTDNLNNAVIPANSMRIIAQDPTTLTGESYTLDDFLCEWRLDASYVIRVDTTVWEYMFSAPGPDCGSSQGSRVLLYGAGGELLDGVRLDEVNGLSCSDSSYAIDGFFLFDDLTPTVNDSVIYWGCSAEIPEGRRSGDISASQNEQADVASPGYVPQYNEINASFYTAPCFGACCLTNGECIDDVTEAECLEQRCGLSGGFNLSQMCSSVSGTCAAQADEPAKCCLPIGTCVEAGECECLQLNGDWDDSTTCDVDPTCDATVDLILNELDYDGPGSDADEYIELLGSGSLAGWTIELHNGNASSTSPTLYETIDLSQVAGGQVPEDGYLVVGSASVPNVDYIAWESNGIQNGTPGGDGVVLLFNNLVVEAFSYESGTNGFEARGGNADGLFLNDLGVSDSSSTTLQKLPDGGDWFETANGTPGTTNLDAGAVGACCNAVAGDCQVLSEGECTALGGDYNYLGDGTSCDPNPCIPTGACCVPDGSCMSDVYEDTCVNVLGGSWNGANSVCPDIDNFVTCLDASGPAAGLPAQCGSYDFDADTDVDLRDFSYFQLDVCAPAPTGACCIPDGSCEVLSQWECEAFYGAAAWNGVGSDCGSTGCSAEPAGAILINEVWAEDPGADDHEFIELFGAPSTSLAGYSLIIVEGETNGDTMAPAYRRVVFSADLSGYALDASGYFVMGTGPDLAGVVDANLDAVFGDNDGVADEIQNGSQTYALIPTSLLSGAFCTTNGVPDAYCTDAEDQLTEAAVAAITANAVDAVATRYGSFDSFYFNAPLVQDDGFYVPDYMQRIPNGTDTNVAADWETVFGSELGDPADPSSPGMVNMSQLSIPGACCVDTTCMEVTLAECTSNNGTFGAFGSVCEPTTCNCDTIANLGFIDYPEERPVCIVDAIVTNTYDLINSSTSKNFYIQNATSPHAVTVYGANEAIDALLVQLNEGDQIEITGTQIDYYGQMEIDLGLGDAEVTVVGSPGVPAPIELTAADFSTDYTGAGDPRRQYLGALIRLNNVEFAASDQGGTFTYASSLTYEIHDASNPSVTTLVRINNSDPSALPIVGTTIPSGPVDVVGIMTSFSNKWQIQPRVPGDITPAN